MPDANNDDAYDYAGSGALFSAGQTLSVSASGGVVPAFGPTSVVAPPTPVLTQPAAISGMYTIATSADLPVVWTGGQPGDLFLLEGTDSSGQSYFTCTWDAAAGMATVPQPVLAGLADQPGAFLYYAQIATTNVTVDGYAISVSALPFSGGTASFQ
jgi:hypothetical protein